MLSAHQRATCIGWIAILLWSSTVAFVKSITEHFDPTFGMALAYAISGVLVLLKTGIGSLRAVPLHYILICGTLFSLYGILLPLALALTTSGQQALEIGLINYLWPSLIIVFSIVLLKQHVRCIVYPGICLAFLGIVFCVAGDSLDLRQSWNTIQTNPWPYVVALTAAIVWAVYCNTLKMYAQYDCLAFFFLELAAFLGIAMIFTGSPLKQFSLIGLGNVCALGLVNAVAFFCWDIGIKHGNIHVLAIGSYAIPIFSALFASFWLAVSPPTTFWYGVALVVLGSLFCWKATTND